MKIKVRAISEIEPATEMRAPSTLIINVDMDKEQKRNLFYQIWTDVGDEILQEWLNSEEKQMIDLPNKCTHTEYYMGACTACGYKAIIEDETIMELPLQEYIESEAALVLRSMCIAKGYDKEFTEDDVLKGLKLMAASYRKYLLKTV